jgi:hypothetical protein
MQQHYGTFDGLDDDFSGMQQQGGFSGQQQPDSYDEAFEGGGMMQQQQAGFSGGGHNPDSTWDDDFDWEAGGQGAQQGGGMGMGSMGMNAMNGGSMGMNGGEWAGADMNDGSNWAGGIDDGMMGQMGSQMSNQMGENLAQGGMIDDGVGFGPGPGMGGFASGGMRGPGPMGVGPGGIPPGNAAGANPNACFNCGASDHMARNCPHPKDFATQCHKCGEMGHRAKDCTNPPLNQPPPPPMQRPGPGWGPNAGERGQLSGQYDINGRAGHVHSQCCYCAAAGGCRTGDRATIDVLRAE